MKCVWTQTAVDLFVDAHSNNTQAHKHFELCVKGMQLQDVHSELELLATPPQPKPVLAVVVLLLQSFRKLLK
ncbi:MAG: hypothetical protein EBV86_12230 [Marivivens sp.]|nr:hypothetical protein [Marivivens sp.]